MLLLSLWYCQTKQQQKTNNPGLAVVPASFPPKSTPIGPVKLVWKCFIKVLPLSLYSQICTRAKKLKRITLIALMPQCLKQPPHVHDDIETRLLSQQRRKIDYTTASPVNTGCCFLPNRSSRLSGPNQTGCFPEAHFFSFQCFARDIAKYFNQI